jgi:hypothetical protein
MTYSKTDLRDISDKCLKDAYCLMKIISIGEKDIKKGNVISHEDLKNRVSKILDE